MLLERIERRRAEDWRPCRICGTTADTHRTVRVNHAFVPDMTGPAEEDETARAAIDTARAIIATDGRRNTPAELATMRDDALDLAYYIVTPRGSVAPWVRRALVGALPAVDRTGAIRQGR